MPLNINWRSLHVSGFVFMDDNLPCLRLNLSRNEEDQGIRHSDVVLLSGHLNGLVDYDTYITVYFKLYRGPLSASEQRVAIFLPLIPERD